MISNRTRAARSFGFEITRMISDQIALHSVQLPLYILPKDKIILTKKVIHLLSISDDDLDDEAIQSEISSQVSWLEYDEDQSKYFGVVASVFYSHLVSRFFHLFYEQSLL